MTDKHEWPTAPIIQAAWVTPHTDWTPSIGTWTRGSDGNYYKTSRAYVARKGEGYFTHVTEYWPRLGLTHAHGPLTTTPPAKPTWHVGDTIAQGDDLRALPTGTILKAEHKTMAGKIIHKIGLCELEVTGLRGSTYPASIQYPLTIIWLPDTKKEEAE